MHREQWSYLPLIKERFFTNFERGDPNRCWIWSGRKNGDGYGIVRLAKGLKTTGAHRLSYSWYNGPIPDGLIVRHKCDVRNCVNPDHLELGTQADNIRDMMNRGRYKKGKTYHGPNHIRARLTEDEVKAVRNAYSTGLFTYKMLADVFGMEAGSIRPIILRMTYKNVE